MSMTIATRIEKAYGANLTGNPAAWVWTDVSAYALGEVTVSGGRDDEAAQTQPSRCTFRLKNTDSRFSPRHPSSPYYPNVRRQTPVRVSLNPGTGYVQVFQGYVDEIVPSWPSGNSEYAEVAVTASGLLRRLGQGQSPVRSPLYRALSTASPFAYWPLEDGPAADGAASVSGSAISLVRLLATGPAEFGAVKPLSGASAMPSFIRGGALQLVVNSSASSAWTVEFAYFFGTGEPAPGDYSTPNAMNLFKLFAVNGDYWEFQLSPHNTFFANGRIALFRSDQPESFFDTLVDTTLGSYNPWDGQTHHVAVTASQSGGNIAWQLYLDGSVFSSGTLASRTLQAIDHVLLNQNGFLASSSTYGLGHFAVFESVVNPAGHATAARGYAGETATDRLVRLTAEAGISVAITGSSTTAMGAQGVGTILSLLRECETADGGILYDGAGAGLSYLARASRYNRPVSMALDTKRQQVKLPFVPSEDDQQVRNDWTASRTGGSFARFTNPAHIAANGLYDSSGTINIQFDGGLLNQAAWRVHLGTVEEMRVPGLSLQLIDHPELWSAWLAATLGARITAVNLPAQYPPGILDMLLEGYTQTWHSSSWFVHLDTSPFAPWNVVALGSTFRLEMAGQTLNSGLAAGATSLSLATAAGHALFTTLAADFPLDLNVAGWQIHVTNATGSSSPQTLTISASPNTSTIPSGTAVTLWRPAALAL